MGGRKREELKQETEKEKKRIKRTKETERESKKTSAECRPQISTKVDCI